MRGTDLLGGMLATAFILAALAAPAVFAATEDVSGNLEFSRAFLAGQTTTSSTDFRAAALSPPPDMNLRTHWTLTASSLVVNWSRIAGQSAGSVPTNPGSAVIDIIPPEPESEERTYGQSTATTSVNEFDGNLLVVADLSQAASLEVTTARDVRAEPATRETWSAGYSSNRSISLTDARPVTANHEIRPGEPRFSADGPVAWTLRGNFTMHVWGGNVTVDDDSERTTYRSGSWTENATATQAGPQGVKRDQYWQLLRLNVTGGTLVLLHDQGEAKWTGPDATVETFGIVTFDGTRGTLESADAAFHVDGDRLRLQGRIDQRFEPVDGRPFSLAANVHARDAAITGASTVSLNPRNSAGSLLVVTLPLLALGVAAGTVYGIRRYRSRSWSYNLQRAEAALEERRIDDAIRHSGRLLGRQAPTPAAAVDALFLHGAARLESGEPAWLLEELPVRVAELGSPPTLAYLMAVAATQVGDVGAAEEWVTVMRKDPQLIEDFLADPRIAHRRAQLTFLTKSDTAYS